VRSRGFAYYWATAEDVIEPGDAYYERNLPVSLQRLKQGGVRLAGLLNQLVEERQVSGRSAPSATSGALN